MVGENFRAFGELSNDFVWTLDEQGRFTYMNPSAENVSGYTYSELAGTNFSPKIPPEDLPRAMGIFSRVLSGEKVKFEIQVVKKCGGLISLSVNAAPLLHEGKANGAICFGRDITEERRVKAELEENLGKLNLLSRIIEQMGEGVASIDLEGNLIYVNPAWAKMHGYEPQELIGKPIGESHTKEQLDREVIPFNRLVMENGIHTGEVGHIRRDGSQFPTEMTSTLLRDSASNLIGIIGFAKDITEAKRAEEALRQSEERLRHIIDNIDEIVYRVEFGDNPMEGRVTYVSPQSSGILGCAAEEFIENESFWAEHLHPDDVESIATQTRESLALGKPFMREYRLRHKDGHYLWLEDRVVPQVGAGGRVTGFQGVARDITERKRFEEEILKKNRQLTALFSSSQAMGEYFEPARAEKNICEAAVSAFGAAMACVGTIDTETLEVKPMASAGFDDGFTSGVKVRWDDSPLSRGPAGKAIKTGRPCLMGISDPDYAPWAEEAESRGYRSILALPLLHADSIRGVIVMYHGDPMGFDSWTLDTFEIFARQATQVLVNASLYNEALSTIRELIESREALERAEKLLKVRNAFFEELFASSPDAIAILDQEDRILNVNRAFERMFQRGFSDINGAPINSVVVPESKEDEARQISESALAGNTVEVQTVRRRGDGVLIPVSIVGAPIRIGEEQLGVLAIYRDLSGSNIK